MTSVGYLCKTGTEQGVSVNGAPKPAPKGSRNARLELLGCRGELMRRAKNPDYLPIPSFTREKHIQFPSLIDELYGPSRTAVTRREIVPPVKICERGSSGRR